VPLGTSARTKKPAVGVALSRLTADHDLERHLDRVQLAPGFSYAEEFVGTNGIGTALESGQAARVFGHEHYAGQLVDLACAAVLIRHSVSGKAVGAVNLTSWHKDAGRLIALAQSTARQVTQGLLNAPRKTPRPHTVTDPCRIVRRSRAWRARKASSAGYPLLCHAPAGSAGHRRRVMPAACPLVCGWTVGAGGLGGRSVAPFRVGRGPGAPATRLFGSDGIVAGCDHGSWRPGRPRCGWRRSWRRSPGLPASRRRLREGSVMVL